MKTIRIFLASSEELKDERQKFGNLIRQLDDIFIKRGIHIQLLVWEDMDPSYNNCRKQDEYNAWIRESQIFVALFYTRAGQYTLEELEVARTENCRRQEPKLMIYCRSLQPGDVEEQDLQEFKQTLEKQLGHFWGNYATTDKLHLDFVMYFMRSTEGHSSTLKVENGQVVLDGFTVASMDNLPFAAGNEGYLRMQAEIQELSKEIEETRGKLEKKKQKLKKKKVRLEKEPDDEDNKEEYEEAKEEVDYLTSILQSRLNKYNALQDQFASHQQALLDTAKRVSEMQLEKVSSELGRAVGEFEQGHIEAANAILDVIEHEANRHMEQLERNRTLVHQDIEAFMLQAKTVMADTFIPINERINKTAGIYAKADDWAQKSALPDEKYESLLINYVTFLYFYAQYDKSLSVCQRLIVMREAKYGKEDLRTAELYNLIGCVYNSSGNYQKALDYHNKALSAREKALGLEHPNTAQSYHNISSVYENLHCYEKVIEYLPKALAIREKLFGLEHPITAETYCNIGGVFDTCGVYSKAMDYYSKALAIYEKAYGSEHLLTGSLYNNIGFLYTHLVDYDKAIEYYFKDLEIRSKSLGPNHPDIAQLYNNIGCAYDNLGNYSKAIDYCFNALAIREKVLGPDHLDTAGSYYCIGDVYKRHGNYTKALEYYSKAMLISKRTKGLEPSIIEALQNKINLVKQEIN